MDMRTVLPCRYRVLAWAALGIFSSAGAWAAAGAPLPRCAAGSDSFYLMRYIEPGTPDTAPQTILQLSTVPPNAGDPVASTVVWSGQTAPTPSPRDLSRNAGATVAAGMGKDGYIYAMRAIGINEPGWDLQGRTWREEWKTHTRHYEMLRYGRDGVDNLGIVRGLGVYQTDSSDDGTRVDGATDARLGPNFNAADIDPVSGHMILASFQQGGALNQLFRIDVTQSPPQYVSTITLSKNIPGAQSGDFAIDAAGQYAYGVAKARGTFGNSTSYRIELATGAVTDLAPNLGIFPYGAAARLPSGKFAFYNTFQTNVMTVPGGTLEGRHSTETSDGSDGAACLPKIKARLECTPTSLVDADGNVSTCTVTLDQPAPAGGLEVALTSPTDNPRYSTTCGASVQVPQGATSAQCTVTATPNTTPGDGEVTATVALATPPASGDYELDSPSSADVLVRNDDKDAPVGPTKKTPLPTLGEWAVILLSMAMAGLAMLRLRRTAKP
ncbi:IPTL-CTERM sorting domain-containing protein [Acidovorax sp. Leaf160]|uniref:IPTL-CTERM sorting domain-containing protein n=1 Tax=Acidovorax sp. Leaf160 TaxID=1736280 RepID=UPI0009E9D2D5|nr:IPTL-CTERM sorting domain-containing protein [Acidovorax sp. Leaf160]